MDNENQFFPAKIEKPKPAYHQVVEHIQNAIIEGRLLPGDKLPNERELSNGFNVSRRTLREALRVLEEKGLLQTVRSGTLIKQSNVVKFSEGLNLLMRFKRIPWKHLIEFRAEIESAFVKKAINKITSEDIAELEKFISKGNALMEEDKLDYRKLINLDLNIHLTIAKISGNEILEWFLKITIDNLMTFFENTIRNPEEFAIDSFKDMAALVNAIKQNDTNYAVSIIRDHIKILDKKYVDHESSASFSFEASANNWGLDKDFLE